MTSTIDTPGKPAPAMDWQTFEAAWQFEDTVYRLASASLQLLGESAFKDQAFSAFAFNASFPSMSLSVDTRPDNRELEYYPPDWSNECIEVDVPAIGELWEQGYAAIADAFGELIERMDDDGLLDAIDAGCMHSLRKVMVRLETSHAFDSIKTCARFWTLVTQVDADTDEEERLLDQVRLAAADNAQLSR